MEFTADKVREFYEHGSGWWWLADGELTITDTQDPPSPDAMYLMPWDAAWFAQWASDWAAAAEQLTTILWLSVEKMQEVAS